MKTFSINDTIYDWKLYWWYSILRQSSSNVMSVRPRLTWIINKLPPRWSSIMQSRKTISTLWGTAVRRPTWRKIRIQELFPVSMNRLLWDLGFYIFIISILDDFNRVVLEPEADVADSDYVNASYVDVSWKLLFSRVHLKSFLLISSLSRKWRKTLKVSPI